MLADFAAEIARFSLTKKLSVELNFAKRLIGLATGIGFVNHSSDIEGEDWKTSYEKLKVFDSTNSDTQSELTFAIGTFAWFLARNGRNDLVGVAVSHLNSLPIKKVVELYQRGQGLRRWYSWWFVPEGKRVSWSSRVDHDIREALLLRIALGKISAEDVLNLPLLESPSSVTDFINDLKICYEQMTTFGISNGAPLEENEAAITEAKHEIEKRRLDQIRGDTKLSEKKIAATNASFSEFLQKHDPSGVLYQLKVSKDAEFKGSHYVGTYMLYEKEWFLEDKGYVSHSVMGMGSSWAENLVLGRESLLAEKLKQTKKFEKLKLDKLRSVLENIRDNKSSEYVLLINSLSVPWELRHEFFKNAHQLKPATRKFAPGQIARIGEVDVFSGRQLLRGQIALFPKATFTWLTKAKCVQPEVRLIIADSDEGKALRKQKPELDFELKVIIEAREFGTMMASDELLASVQAWNVIAKDDDLI